MPGVVAPHFYGVMAALPCLRRWWSRFAAGSYTGMLGLLALFGDTVFFLVWRARLGPHVVAGLRFLLCSCWRRPWSSTPRSSWS